MKPSKGLTMKSVLYLRIRKEAIIMNWKLLSLFYVVNVLDAFIAGWGVCYLAWKEKIKLPFLEGPDETILILNFPDADAHEAIYNLGSSVKPSQPSAKSENSRERKRGY